MQISKKWSKGVSKAHVMDGSDVVEYSSWARNPLVQKNTVAASGVSLEVRIAVSVNALLKLIAALGTV